MGVYSRFKKDASGFRNLVELLESTPKERRDRMIEVGQSEDPDYTNLALKYMLSFEDILNLPDLELAELMHEAPGRVVAMAICKQPKEVKERFMRQCIGTKLGELRDDLDSENSLAAIGGAQLKVISIARQLEKKGRLRTKRIPQNAT